MGLDGINHLSGWWWQNVLHASWQTAVVGSAVLLLVHSLGRRWPAPLRYALLVVALLKFAFPPLLPVPTGLFSHVVAPRINLPTSLERKPPPATDFRAAHRALGVGGLAWTNPWPKLSWAGWLMVVHGTGAALIAVWVGTQASRLRALVRASRRRLDPRLGDEYRDLAIQLGVYRIPPLAISEEVPSPMAFGIKRAAIMLPTRIMDRLSAAELRTVLAHELAHCQRGDLWLNWLQLGLLAVWWFHPVAWLLHFSLRDVREDCCDDLLLARRLVSNDGYCDVLLRAATELCPILPLSAALGFGTRVHPLARRLARITDWTLQRRENVSYASAAAVLASALLLLPGLRKNEAQNNLLPPGAVVSTVPLVSVETSVPLQIAPAQPVPTAATVSHASAPAAAAPLPYLGGSIKPAAAIAAIPPSQVRANSLLSSGTARSQAMAPSRGAVVPYRLAPPIDPLFVRVYPLPGARPGVRVVTWHPYFRAGVAGARPSA